MNSTLENSVISYLQKLDVFIPYLKGFCWTRKELEACEKDLGFTLPKWYKELLIKHPLRKINIGVQLFESEEEHDGIEYVTFCGVDTEECLNLCPGCHVLEKGFICIGSDVFGSGDPFFISIHEGDNPPVYQIYHDLGDDAEFILENGKVLVADSLSDFFENAIIDYDMGIEGMNDFDLDICHKKIFEHIQSFQYARSKNYLNELHFSFNNIKLEKEIFPTYDDITLAVSEFDDWVLSITELPQDIRSIHLGLFETDDGGVVCKVSSYSQWDEEDFGASCISDIELEKPYIGLTIGQTLSKIIKTNSSLGIYLSVTLFSWLFHTRIKDNLLFENIHFVISFDDGDLYKII